MPLIPTLTKADIAKAFAKQRRLIENAILLNIQYVAEQAVAYARDVRTYQDQTGNLRASIGYLILHNGKISQVSLQGYNDGRSVNGQKLRQATGWQSPDRLGADRGGGYGLRATGRVSWPGTC